MVTPDSDSSLEISRFFSRWYFPEKMDGYLTDLNKRITMYTLADKSQFQAWVIHEGRHQLATVHRELLDWITKQFGVNALDFFCEKREPSKGTSQQLIHLILETPEDVKKMQGNRAEHTVINERFLKYFKSADSHSSTPDPLKSNVFPAETNPFPEIIVTYRPLKGLNSEALREIFNDEKDAILKTFESVWTVSQAVVFYYTDAQVKENQTNGTSTKVSEQLQQVEKRYYGEPGHPYSFDSKESFDRDYESKWHYYWK